MGYHILWVEILAAGLFLVATLLAAIVRRSRWFWRVFVLMAMIGSFIGLTFLPDKWVFLTDSELYFWFSMLVAFLVLSLCALWRFSTRFCQIVFSLLLAMCLVAMPATVMAFAAYGKFEVRIPGIPFYPLLIVSMLFAVGTIFLLFRALWRGSGAVATACSWASGKLFLCFLVAAILASITYTNLDTAVVQQMTTMRLEVQAKALAIGPRYDDRDNAAPMYVQAAAEFSHYYSIQAQISAEKLDKWLVGEWDKTDFSDPELLEYLDHQRHALALLRKATAMPFCRFDWDYGDPDQLLREIPGLQIASRVLWLDAGYQVAIGHLGEALLDVADIYNMAQSIDAPFFILVGITGNLEREGTKCLETILSENQLNEGELAEYKKAIYKPVLIGQQQRLARAFKHNAKILGPAIFARAAEPDSHFLPELYRQYNIRLPIVNLFDSEAFVSLWRVFLLKSDLESFVYYYNNEGQFAAEPYYKVQKYREEFLADSKREVGLVTRSWHANTNTWAGTLSKQVVIVDVYNRLARLAVAAKEFKIEHGDWPENIDQLHIYAIPLDPFDGKPLRMKRDGEGLILYSVGPDMIDDGGAALDEKEKTGDIVFHLK